MKYMLTGSSLFFSSYADFEPHDFDFIALNDYATSAFGKERLFDLFDVFIWKRMTPDEYIAYCLTAQKSNYRTFCPMQLCTFLCPQFCRQVGFTTEHLKKLQPLADAMDAKHVYLSKIFECYIDNGKFSLTNKQRDAIYAEYKKERAL